MRQIQTVTGPVEELGLTLVHEHLLVGYPGWQMDALAPPFVRAEVLARAVDKLAELHGLTPELERTLLCENPARYFAGTESPLR